MKNALRLALFVCVLITTQLRAWQPDGWVYQNGNNFYSVQTQSWYWKQPDWNHWVVRLNNGAWQKTAVNGWSFYQWPYFWSFSQDQWYWSANPGAGADVVSFNTGSWSIFGQEVVSAGFAAIPEPGEQKWWDYETVGPIAASLSGVNLTLYPSGPIHLVHNGNSGRRTIYFGGDLSGDTQGYDVSGDFDFTLTEAMSRQGGELVLDGGSLDFDMGLSIDGINATAAMTADYSFSPVLDASLSPLLRDDLWNLPVGHTESYTTSAWMDGSIDISVPSEGTESLPFSDSATASETWRVVSKLDSYAVNGRTFRNVVKVRRTTYMPDLQGQGLERVEIDVWLAEGVGLVEARNYFQVYGQPVDLKIVDSSEF